jgi:hypothetical protein
MRSIKRAAGREGKNHAIHHKICRKMCIGNGDILSALPLLPDKAKELHRALFELIPGFVWGNAISMTWGALYMGLIAWIVGSYIAWMHNASIVTGEK